jgi:lipid-A-disaccharide synthase
VFAAPDILSAQMSNVKNIAADRPLRVMISAGEASGEMYGAELLAALRRFCGGGNAALPAAGAGVECFGMGGERMSEAGCELIVHARDVAVVGLFEVLSHLPKIYREFHKLLAEVDRRRPDVAVLIDFPDWNLRLAKQLRRRGIPVVYYVSPQLWAWRKGRLKLVQRDVSEMLVIIPFEREFYARNGVQVEFVGHPLSELELPKVSREDFAARWGLDASRTWIALLPGSRRKELRLNLPAMLGAAARLSAGNEAGNTAPPLPAAGAGRLGAGFEFVMPVASTLDQAWVREQIALCASGKALRSPTLAAKTAAKVGHPQPVDVKLTDDARASLLHARVGVVASGTATVEAALIGTPFVMVYRVAGLTWMLGRHLVKLPHYCMVNLVAGRELVPELVQNGFTPASVEREVRALLEDGGARQRMSNGLAEVRGRLRGELADAPIFGSAGQSTAERAARAILRVAENALRRKESAHTQ